MSKRHVWVLHRTKASTGKQHLWCYGGMWGRGLPGGPGEGTYGCLEGPRLGPVWAGTGLYSRAPPQPPIYTPSFCILSSSTSFSVTSCMILNFWFWELIQSWGKSTHTLLVWLSKNLGDICMIPPTLFSTSGICFVWFTNVPHWSKPALSYLIMLIMTIMTMTMMTLRETSLATTATDSSVCTCSVWEGTKPQKSYSALLQYSSIVLCLH